MQGADFLHHRLINPQTPGGIDDQYIMVVLFRVIEGSERDVNWLVGRAGGEKISTDLRGDGLQLPYGRGTINVGGDSEYFFLFLFLQKFGKLADSRGFAGALQAGH